MPPSEHRFAHEAMATTFEVFAWHDDRDFAARAAQSAFDLIDRLEADLSHYRPTSDIGRLNAASAGTAVKVGIETFDCLRLSQRAWHASSGLFDVTIGTLYAAWRDGEDRPREPTTAQIQAALALIGMDKLALNEAALTATKSVGGLTLSLGGIGKGYALDLAAAQMREDHGLTRTLWHSGHSTILAGEPPPGQEAWAVGLGGSSVPLARRSLSSSGTAVRGGHILNPRTGQPASGRARVWAYAETGAVSDAASTSAMLMDESERARFRAAFPDVAFVLPPESR